jgi:hypothetical protein
MAKVKEEKKEVAKVKFLKSPTGKYGYAYHIGDTAEIEDKDLVEEMIDSGWAEVVK